MIESVQARLAPYFSALRRRGPRDILAELYDLNVNHRLMRKVVYPKLGEWHLAQLRRDNQRRRAKVRSAGASPAPGRVFVVICVDTEGPTLFGESHDWAAVEAEVRAFSEPAFRATL